jgi:hypothetical protein
MPKQVQIDAGYRAVVLYRNNSGFLALRFLTHAIKAAHLKTPNPCWSRRLMATVCPLAMQTTKIFGKCDYPVGRLPAVVFESEDTVSAPRDRWNRTSEKVGLFFLPTPSHLNSSKKASTPSACGAGDQDHSIINYKGDPI